MDIIIAALLVGGMLLCAIFTVVFFGLELLTDWEWLEVATIITGVIGLICAACIIVILVFSAILSAM